MSLKAWLALATSLAGSTWPVAAVEWSQYRGPNHDGASTELIRTNWPASGLQTIWKIPMRNGFSAISLGGGKAFTLVTDELDGGDQEVCVALDAAKGNKLWEVPLGIAKYDGGGDSGTSDNNGGDGPRSTPSYDNGKVYVYSSRMVLKCLDATTGNQIWACDLMKEHAGKNIMWETAASPLVEGDLVYVACGGPGQALLAFDKNDGHVVWKGQDDGLTQSTPVAATILGQRQIIFFTQKGLVSVDPKTGEPLWRYPFPRSNATAISPVVAGDIVYCSAAYGKGASACRITKQDGKFTATQLWMKPGNTQANHWSTPVCKDGYIYCIIDQAKFGSAALACVEAATGEVRWTRPGFGMGGLTLANGCVLALTDAGDLVLVKADSGAYTEVSRAHVLAGKCWNCVSVSDGRVYARSTKEGVSLDLSTP